MREESIAQGREDPGRTFPKVGTKLINEFEYIPVIPSPFRFQVHNVNTTPTTPTLLFLTMKNSGPALYYIFKRLISLS